MKKHNIILFSLLTLFIFNSCKKNTITPSISELRNISELAVLDCFYHTVAKKNKPADGIGKNDKTMWYEFNVELKLGIDTSKIKMDINETDVTIVLPPIQAIGDPIIPAETINCVSSVDGWRKTVLTPEEQFQVVEDAKNDVINKIHGGDPALIKNAESRVKTIIESYINRMGEQCGIEYTITWKSLEEENQKALQNEKAEEEKKQSEQIPEN